MSLQFIETVQTKINIKCPKCGHDGALIWEKRGAELYLADLSPGFYERVSKKPPFRIELVCDGCGSVQPTAGLGDDPAAMGLAGWRPHPSE